MQNSSLYSHIKAQQQQPQFPEQEQLKCPRCDSANTKFCYYNNYNLSQPRHFCRNCKRYWTKGGALRNIPVGGGSRKNSKRSSSAKSTASKRPSTASVSSSKERADSDRDSAGKMFDKMPLRGENCSGQFDKLSFSSLLGSGRDQYVGLLNGPGLELNGDSGSNLIGVSGDEFLNLLGGGGGGSGGDGGGDWGDLSIYTPSSNFQ